MRRSRRCGGCCATTAGPHARLLGEPFAGYELHDGGVGTGTVIGYRLRVGRNERSYVLAVEEPTPGRQLRERDHHGRLLPQGTQYQANLRPPCNARQVDAP